MLIRRRIQGLFGPLVFLSLPGPISDLRLGVLLVDDGVGAVGYSSIPLSSDLVHLLQELLAIVLLQASAGAPEGVHGISLPNGRNGIEIAPIREEGDHHLDQTSDQRLVQ